MIAGSVFILLTAGIFYSRPFAENVTVTKMWRFVEGVSQPLAKKKKSKLK